MSVWSWPGQEEAHHLDVSVGGCRVKHARARGIEGGQDVGRDGGLFRKLDHQFQGVQVRGPRGHVNGRTPEGRVVHVGPIEEDRWVGYSYRSSHFPASVSRSGLPRPGWEEKPGEGDRPLAGLLLRRKMQERLEAGLLAVGLVDPVVLGQGQINQLLGRVVVRGERRSEEAAEVFIVVGLEEVQGRFLDMNNNKLKPVCPISCDPPTYLGLSQTTRRPTIVCLLWLHSHQRHAVLLPRHVRPVLINNCLLFLHPTTHGKISLPRCLKALYIRVAPQAQPHANDVMPWKLIAIWEL